MKNPLLALLSLLWLLWLPAGVAHAQTFPTKPLRMIAPVPPGGILDVVGRLLAQKITEQTGQTVLVENRPGGLTNVGSEFVARSAGDGYTWLLQSIPLVVNPVVLGKMPYDHQRDLAPLSLVVTSPYLFVVHPSVPAKNIRELIAVARAQPNKITYATAGSASNLHIAVELFNVMASIKTLHIPYKGGGPALTAVLGGESDLAVLASSAVLPYVSGGRMRALAITSPKRMAMLPHIPTVAESGLPGYDFASWAGLLASSATPAVLINTVNGIIVKGARAPDLVERFTKDATEVVANSPAEFKTFLQAEAKRWAKVVKDSGMRAD